MKGVKIRIPVRCPECGFEEEYVSRKRRVERRRKRCGRCGVSYDATTQDRRRFAHTKEGGGDDRPRGFFRYTKKGTEERE